MDSNDYPASICTSALCVGGHCQIAFEFVLHLKASGIESAHPVDSLCQGRVYAIDMRGCMRYIIIAWVYIDI